MNTIHIAGLGKSVLCIIILAALAATGCGRNSTTITTANQITWMDQFKSSTNVILTGRWNDAENAWSSLQKADMNPEQLTQWIQLQVEILKNANADTLKQEIYIG